MVCAGTLICDEQPATMAEQTVTAQDLDRQIRFLKDNIKKYTAMAKAFDRKASRLQSHDYNGYRAAAGVRDECQGIANDLQAHLAKLEKQRADMVEQQKTASQTKGE
jgi:uncharacterized protein YbaP (TraB family)